MKFYTHYVRDALCILFRDNEDSVDTGIFFTNVLNSLLSRKKKNSASQPCNRELFDECNVNKVIGQVRTYVYVLPRKIRVFLTQPNGKL